MQKAVAFTITGMHCMSCVKIIESAVTKNEGVFKVEVDLAGGEVRIHFDPESVTVEDLEESIKAAGYEVLACRIYNAQDSENRDPGVSPQTVGPFPYLLGTAVAVGAVGFYLGFITLTSDWSNAWMQFTDYRWWILALAAGLGVQAALFSYLRRRLRGRNIKAAKSGLAASGGMSTASMAACCAHYVAAFLPVLGLSFLSPLAAGLAEYQREFFFLGLLSNLVGIGIMLRLMNKNGIFQIKTQIKSLMSNFNFGLSRS